MLLIIYPLFLYQCCFKNGNMILRKMLKCACMMVMYVFMKYFNSFLQFNGNFGNLLFL